MTQEHTHAAILRAIADGKQIQDKTEVGCYTDISAAYALRVISNGGWLHLRVKPETITITINGVECPKPPPVGNYVVTISRENKEEHLFFTTKEDARQVFEALVLPFKEAV